MLLSLGDFLPAQEAEEGLFRAKEKVRDPYRGRLGRVAAALGMQTALNSPEHAPPRPQPPHLLLFVPPLPYFSSPITPHPSPLALSADPSISTSSVPPPLLDPLPSCRRKSEAMEALIKETPTTPNGLLVAKGVPVPPPTPPTSLHPPVLL